MSLIHLARQGFITKSALPNVTRQRGTTTGTANLMLYGAGKNFAIGTNTTFTDSSTNNFTVTRNGDTIQATNNPFTGSVYFDGTDDYLSVANNTALQPGTGAFTIECWIFRSVADANHTIYAKGGATTGFQFRVHNTNVLRFTDGSAIIDSTITIPALTWTHVAVVRSSTSVNGFTMYINGVQSGQGTVSTDFNQTEEVRVGTNRIGADDFNGYISCLRFVKGTAVYTANFTVPTSPLTAITNTQLLLLTAQQAPFRDSSSNNFTVTANGNAAGSGLEPFPVNYAGSGYFDGNGDYLITNVASTQFDFDTGDFTIETWVYPIATGTAANETYLPICGADGSFSPNTSNWSFLYAVTGGNRLVYSTYENGVGYYVASNAYTPTFNVWQHWACVRSGGVVTFYVNGVSIGGGSFTRNQSYNNKLIVGIMYGGFTAKSVIWYSTMYLSNLRILKGTAQYTANFTPPAAPLTAVTNTSLLLLTNNVGPFVDTSANGFPILRNGDTVQTGFSPFTGQPSAGSGYYDGNGDYLSTSINNNIIPTTGNFTFETWIYPTSTSQGSVIAFRGNSSAYAAVRLLCENNQLFFLASTSGSSWAISTSYIGSAPINNWHHVAITRNGGTFTLFLNGTSIFTSTAIASGTSLMTGSYNYIGVVDYTAVSGSFIQYFTGYISNFRVINGTALYTSNFTPATAPLPAVPNTSLLLNTDNYTIANSTPTYRAITLSGNTTISTAQYPTGMNRSIAFDGNSDYVQVPNDAAIADFGTGDFTIELFINITSVDYVNGGGGRAATAITTVVGFIGNGWNVEFSGNASGVPSSISFSSRQGASQISLSNSVTMSKAVWYHVAVTRSGTVTTIYLDGVSIASGTLSNQTVSSTQPMWIGGQNISTYQHWLTGYISNVRIVKGSALYTANFTPPAAPLPLSVTVPNNVTNNIYGVYQLA